VTTTYHSDNTIFVHRRQQPLQPFVLWSGFMESFRGELDAYLTLTPLQKESLRTWIAEQLGGCEHLEVSSFELRALFERAANGFYVTHEQMAGAMLTAGYQPLDRAAVHWVCRPRTLLDPSRTWLLPAQWNRTSGPAGK
jgi:hypothetical protein